MIVKYTEEEKAKALEIEERYRKEIIKAQDGADRTRIAYEMTMALRDFANECRKEHFKQFANDPAAIIANAEEIAVAVLEDLHNLFNRPFSSHIDFDELEECIVRNGDNILIKSDYATQCILDELELHAEALKDKRDKDKLFAVVAEVVKDSEYTNNSNLWISSVLNNANMTVPNGKASNALSRVSRKAIETDQITRLVSMTINGVTIKSSEPGPFILGIGAHKLLKTAEAEFLQQNHYSKSKTATPSVFRVSIPEFEYIKALNDNINERETNTPEEAQKEKKRVENLRKKIHKDIKRDLDILYNASLDFDERIRGKSESFANVRIISSKGIVNGMINISFTPEYAEYICRLPLSKYAKSLIRIDARSNNAYSIGVKIAEHYNMDSNVARGTESRLRVGTLLECTDLKSIEEIRSSRNSWQQRIKEPFENALDQLTGIIISDWKYTHSKGVELSEQEAYNITNYDEWEKLYVDYVVLNPEDHTERRQRRRDEREEKKRKRARKSKKSKSGV